MLGILLFSPSLLSIFDRGGDVTMFGIPVLILFMFGSWAGLILIAALLIIKRQLDAPEPLDVIEED